MGNKWILISLIWAGVQSAAQAQTWANKISYPAQTGSYVAVFDAVPSQAGSTEDVVMGFLNGTPSYYRNLAAIARFNSSGAIDARSGSIYTSMNTVRYLAGLKYHYRFEIDVKSRTYTAYVTPPGGARTLLAQNYAFRNDQSSVTKLNGFATGTAYGGLTISDFRLIPSTPNLSASAVNSGQIKLSWSQAAAPAGYSLTSYLILRDGNVVASVPGSQLTYTDSELTASTSHSYQVTAVQNDGALSAQSAAVAVTTQAATPAPAPTPAPISLSSCSGTNGSTMGISGKMFEVENAGKSYSLTCPNAQTLRFELRSGDHWVSSNFNDLTMNGGSERTEVEEDVHSTAGYGYSADTTININYDFMLEQINSNTSSWMVLGQLHQVLAGGPPPIAIAMYGEHMVVIIRNSSGAENDIFVDPNPIQRGHYYSIAIQVNFANGALSVVRDGVKIVNFNGPIGYGPSERYYWKHGIYRSPTTNDVEAANYMNFMISP